MVSTAYTISAQFTDFPITDKVPKKYMLNLINSLRLQNLSKEEVLNILEQAVLDYDDNNKVVSIFSKPRPKRS
jgi:hypothetical protein